MQAYQRRNVRIETTTIADSFFFFFFFFFFGGPDVKHRSPHIDLHILLRLFARTLYAAAAVRPPTNKFRTGESQSKLLGVGAVASGILLAGCSVAGKAAANRGIALSSAVAAAQVVALASAYLTSRALFPPASSLYFSIALNS